MTEKQREEAVPKWCNANDLLGQLSMELCLNYGIFTLETGMRKPEDPPPFKGSVRGIIGRAYSAGLAAREPTYQQFSDQLQVALGLPISPTQIWFGSGLIARAEALVTMLAAATERERVLREALEKAVHRLERIDGFGCPQDILDDMRAAYKETK